MNLRRPSLAVLAVLVLAACSREEYTATLATGDEVSLVRANKGHELVLKKGEQLARIRLVGIYTFDPEAQARKDIMKAAKQAVEAMHQKKGAPLKVVLEREAPDGRGRFLGYVEADGVDLGRQLVEEGSASVYTEFPFKREADYFASEDAARAQKRGIWTGNAAQKRILALRDTWSAVRLREFGSTVRDPVLVEAAK